jgi:hypothetical protein
MGEEDGDTGDGRSTLPDPVTRAARGAGRRFEAARRAYRSGRGLGTAELPADGEGRARIVCRRHADRRAVFVDEDGRPECFDPDHPACVGYLEDIRRGQVETWEP